MGGDIDRWRQRGRSEWKGGIDVLEMPVKEIKWYTWYRVEGD